MGDKGSPDTRVPTWFILLLTTAAGLLFAAPEVRAEWQVTQKNRWTLIARKLERQYLKRPRQGYALRRLLQHYRRKGGYLALLKQLHRTAKGMKKRPSSRTLTLAMGLVALKARDTKRALPWLNSLLLPALHRHLTATYNPLSGRKRADARRPSSPNTTSGTSPSPSSHNAHSLNKQQRRIVRYWAQAQFLQQRWQFAQRAYELLLHKKLSRRRKLALRRRLLLLTEKQGRWNAVQRHYQALIVLQPKDASLRQARARVLLRLGRKQQALVSLRSALRWANRRQTLKLWLQIARIHLLLENPAKALNTIKQIRRRIAPRHWMHRIVLVLEKRAHRQQKTLPTLLAQYKGRVKREPRRYLPLIPKLEQELQRNKQALRSYQVLLKRYPKHPALRDFVALLHRMRRYKLAQSLLEQRIKQKSDELQWPLLLVVTLHRSKQPRQRDLWITRVVKQHHQERSFLYPLLEKMEKWKVSESLRLGVYRKLCTLPPASVNCYDRWGALLWKKGQKEEALSVWEKILRMKPTHPSHWFKLAQIYQKHKYLYQSQRLLERLQKRFPSYKRAQEKLAEIYLRRRQPEQAIPLLKSALRRTNDLSRRSNLRDSLLRAMLQRDHHTVVTPLLLRSYALAPLKKEPRKLLLTYYLRHSYRFRRYRRYYGRRFMYQRWFGSKRRPSYSVRFRPLKITIPSNIQTALYEGLQIFPKDAELHQMAVRVYRKQPVVLYHLYQLMLLHPRHVDRYIHEFRQRSHRLGRMHLLLPLLQKLTQRYPNRSKLWGELGREALHRKKVSMAQAAYQRALQLDTKPFAYRCGLANTYAKQKRWSKALQALQVPPPQETASQRALRHRQSLRYGLEAGLTHPQLAQLLQKQVGSQPANTLQFLYALYQYILPTDSAQEQQFLQHILRQNKSAWRVYLRSTAPDKQRLQALTLLHVMDEAAFLQRLSTILQDTYPAIRTMGALAIALHKKRSLFAALDRLERTDSHRMVRVAARFASAALLNRVRSYNIANILTPELWQTWLLPLFARKSFPANYVLPTIARVFPVLPLYLKRQIFATIQQMSPHVLGTLNHMLTYSQQRCFSYAVLSHLKQSNSGKEMKEAVNSIILPKRFFRYYCSLKRLTPPASSLSIHACHQTP